MPRLSPLPIDSLLAEVLATLEKSNVLVLQASPGCGKTTRLPPALLDAKWSGEREILVLEPRRLAAKMAATRVAAERGEPLGQTIGYQFRFEKVGGPRTRLRFLTEGMLLRRMLGDPRLQNVAAVVLDEFHERHLQGDVALSYLRQLQTTARPDLRLVVMSATLDTAAVSTYLGGAPTLSVSTPVHPLELIHLPGPLAKRLEDGVREAVAGALKGGAGGDILVFLPGMGDIRRAESALSALRDSCAVFPLHGELSKEEQERALAPRQGKRKVILSTNVAESSLTIEGVDTVIDSGLHRIASYSWWTGVPSLRTRPISRASAIQRAGRAARQGPGRCFRLFTKHDFDSRPSFETPEIARADISQTLLELKALGVTDERGFPWYESPAQNALESARALLYRLGALEKDEWGSALTEEGKRLASVPAVPRLARLLWEGHRRGIGEKAARLAALISEGDLGDAGLDAIEAAERALVPERVKRQFLSALPDSPAAGGDWREKLAQCALSAFPDRVARRRGDSLVLSAGGSATLDRNASLGPHEFFVTLDVQETQGLGQTRAQLKVRSLCAIEPEWLFDLSPGGPVDEQELRWENEKVVAVSRLRYDGLTLEESKDQPRDRAAAAKLLLTRGLGLDPEAALSPSDWVAKLARVGDAESIENAIARLLLLEKYLPQALGGRKLGEAVLSILEGHLGLASLREVNWDDALAEALAPDQRHRLDQWLPKTIRLPGGRNPRVQYRLDREPWIESRLQDFFGMERGPTILDGRLPLTLHLLAPNGRAQQVTTDLSGFWDRAYPPLRKELSRKYPRHSWPEDPRRAEPPTRKR